MTEQDQPHLVTLVLQSKKALQHGEQLCSQAHNLSNTSSQAAVDVLILDAKVRWITDNVLEQLKLAASVAKSIEEKRVKLSGRVQEWDNLRSKRTGALDDILEELGSQKVPPDFHQTSAESSLFGSQHSEDEDQAPNGELLRQSPSDTVLPRRPPKRQDERRNWKTLRDFVDDQGIENILQTMEDERTSIEDIMSKTHDYPETLTSAIINIRDSLLDIPALPSIEELLNSQDASMVSMARHLESLASHYDQMASALRDSESGEAFSEEDVQQMNRDTDELPSILGELEESLGQIDATHTLLSSTRETHHKNLEQLSHTLDDLEELGDIMGEMLQAQESVEVECNERLGGLEEHLQTIHSLHERYVHYQASFRKLVLEIARRRQYKEAAENIVRGMMNQLESMTEEERHIRERFNNEHGAHLPEDICLCIRNTPTRWEVVPQRGEDWEVLPELAQDFVTQAKAQLERMSISQVNGEIK
ncbi:Autophagy-related protein 17 [Stygiomarasmius scandens]|uniref:Autophagy-related protein 17 n=1 Tax=Marasmiellus scandens TaxID=2682957 RepID=A0ABR1J9V2_9AGAR